jgi:hypothetical protein
MVARNRDATPSATRSVKLRELMPITTPVRSMSGPPLLPGLSVASVWISVTIPVRRTALTMPRGDPMATDLLSRADALHRLEAQRGLVWARGRDVQYREVYVRRDGRHPCRERDRLGCQLHRGMTLDDVRVGQDGVWPDEEACAARSSRCDGDHRRKRPRDDVFEQRYGRGASFEGMLPSEGRRAGRANVRGVDAGTAAAGGRS